MQFKQLLENLHMFCLFYLSLYRKTVKLFSVCQHKIQVKKGKKRENTELSCPYPLFISTEVWAYLEGPWYSDITVVFKLWRTSNEEAPQSGDCARLKGSPCMACHCMFTWHTQDIKCAHQELDEKSLKWQNNYIFLWTDSFSIYVLIQTDIAHLLALIKFNSASLLIICNFCCFLLFWAFKWSEKCCFLLTFSLCSYIFWNLFLQK